MRAHDTTGAAAPAAGASHHMSNPLDVLIQLHQNTGAKQRRSNGEGYSRRGKPSPRCASCPAAPDQGALSGLRRLRPARPSACSATPSAATVEISALFVKQNRSEARLYNHGAAA